MSHPDSDPVYACTLDAEAMRDRLALWNEVARHQVDLRREGARLTIAYEPLPAVADRLRALVAAERDCCAHLGWDLSEEAAALRLVVTAPSEELLPAFPSDPATNQR